jgi:hypothetical protein
MEVAEQKSLIKNAALTIALVSLEPRSNETSLDLASDLIDFLHCPWALRL